MPLYEYQCSKCEHVFDVFAKSFSFDDSDLKCESCGKKGCKRLLSAPMIQIAPDKPDRYARKEMDQSKKVKDRDRAMRNRRKAFGSENVNVSKSDLAKRNHSFQKKIVPKAQGQTEAIDRELFVKKAAQNPKALAAAKKVLGKS